MIDRAASCFRVNELACLFEERVLLAAQHAFLLVHLCITFGRNFYGDAEVLCQSAYIARCHLDAIIDRATIRWTINTVVERFLGSVGGSLAHDRELSPVTLSPL